MKRKKILINNIILLGKIYIDKYLNDFKNKDLDNNWWEALKFFFGKSFARGRRDKLSVEYSCFTIQTLKEYYSISSKNLENSYQKLKNDIKYFNRQGIIDFKENNNIKKRENSIGKKHLETFEIKFAHNSPICMKLLTSEIVNYEFKNEEFEKPLKLNNDEDLMMVFDVLKFISDPSKRNIYNYLITTIKENGVISAYNELIKLRAIGDKLASFIIRDIGFLNEGIINNNFEYAFPIDTWVMKISQQLFNYESNNINIIKGKLIKESDDPLTFAAGLWVLGFLSLDIILLTIKKHKLTFKELLPLI